MNVDFKDKQYFIDTFWRNYYVDNLFYCKHIFIEFSTIIHNLKIKFLNFVENSKNIDTILTISYLFLWKTL